MAITKAEGRLADLMIKMSDQKHLLMAISIKARQNNVTEMLADYIRGKGHGSVEAESNYREMSAATFRRWLSAFIEFIQEISEKYVSLQDAIQDLFFCAALMKDYIDLYRRVGKFPIIGSFSSASRAGLHAPAVE